MTDYFQKEKLKTFLWKTGMGGKPQSRQKYFDFHEN